MQRPRFHWRFLALFLALGIGNTTYAKVVRYTLKATRTPVNLSGKQSVDFAIAVNGSIPAPTLQFTEGDDAEIEVKNGLDDDELSIHWHGILLPVEMDGVPYVTTPTIHPGESLTFKFPIKQHGTYWYHSHTNVQEQKGVYGAFLIHPKKKEYKVDKDVVAVLSDWTDEDAKQVLRNLRKDGDYYVWKKDTMRSYWGAISEGKLGNFLRNEWMGMGGMDLSDVGYDAFLVNGKRDLKFPNLNAGERIRLRLINAAASSYFYVALGQTPMKVISADGVDIDPIETSEILMGMAETYDVLVTVPKDKSLELRATAQDATGFASAWIGDGAKVLAAKKEAPSLYELMDHSAHAGHGEHMAHAEHAEHSEHAHHHEDSVVIPSLTVDQLKAKRSTVFSQKNPVQEIRFVLDGDMARYVWVLNGQAIHEDRTVEIKEGDRVRFIFENQSMMHHPMHLHGHFFRVLTDQKEFSPLKHTVDVAPHQTRTIEFIADAPGEWMLHCHNLYHLKNGMARVIKYNTYTPSEKLQHLQHHDPHLHDHWYFYSSFQAATNSAELVARAVQTWNEVELRTEATNLSSGMLKFDKGWEFEGDLLYRRYLGMKLTLLGGATLFEDVFSAMVGVGYKLPFLLQANVYINHRGKPRIDLQRHFQWFKNIASDFEMRWRIDQQSAHPFDLRLSLLYSPDWHWGAGIFLTNESAGLGFKLQL